MTSPQPPSWAQALLALFVPWRGRDALLGDLLEEYRETQLPARGARGASVWYARQLVGFSGRWCLPWGLAASAIMIARDMYDLSLPTFDFRARAAVTTYACISLFAMAGFVAGWRARRALSGAAVGVGAALIACAVTTLYALTVGALLLHAAYSANPVAYAPLVETADLPLIPILILGTAAGSIGGAVGRLLNRSSGSRAAART